VGYDLDPGSKAPLAAAAVDALEGPDERGLRDFVGLAEVMQPPGARSPNGQVVALEQHGVGADVAGLDGPHKHGVVFENVDRKGQRRRPPGCDVT
jgi:hypothetical protein